MFKKFSKMRDVVVFCSVFVTGLILLHLSLGLAISRRVNKLKTEFREQQSRLKEAQDLIRSVPSPQRAMEEMRKKVQEFGDVGTSRKQIPRLIQVLGESTAKHNIRILSIRPREDIRDVEADLPEGVSKIYIEMVVTGNYPSLGEYIKVLDELPVDFSIEALSMEKREPRDTSTRQQTEVLSCTLLLSTYVVWEI